MKSLPHVWMNRVSSGSIPAVLDLYADSAVLVPTYSKNILRGKAQLLGYFKKFMGERPGMFGTIDGMVEQKVGRTRVYSGIYTFRVPSEGRVQSVRARFTYVVVPTPTGPKIATHHSSEMPK